MTIEQQHKDMVSMLVKDPWIIKSELTVANCNLIHMILGISGEAGELLDAIKKIAIYNKNIDRENVIEELGDIEFYMEGLRQALSITREECLDHNIKKLSQRYARFKYTDKQAQERNDKA